MDNIILTGTTDPSTGPVMPFVINFMLDEQSGVQSFGSCAVGVDSFSASNLMVSHFSATVGGQSIPTGSAAAAAGGSGNCGGMMYSALLTGNLAWEFDIPSVGSSPDLNALLLSRFDQYAIMDGYDLNIQQVSISPVSVLEPQGLWLLLFGLALLQVVVRRRRHEHSRRTANVMAF